MPLQALSGFAGTTGAWLHATDVEALLLERDREGTHSQAMAPNFTDSDGVSHWMLSDSIPGDQYRLTSDSEAGDWMTPTWVAMGAVWEGEDMLWSGESVQLTPGSPGDSALAHWVGIFDGSDSVLFLDPTCLASSSISDCVSKGAGPVSTTALTLTADHDTPQWVNLILVLTPQHEGKPLLAGFTLDQNIHSVVSMSRELMWGDLHAHSNLSHDGCEDPDAGCASRGEQPAEDFFEQAIDVGLDFAAITDHAETVYWHAEGPSSEGHAIWDLQRERALEAEGSAVIPILGYEWTRGGGTTSTNEDGFYKNGHKTVILEDIDACLSWRLASTSGSGLQQKVEVDEAYTVLNPLIAATPDELYSGFEQAAKECGAQRALSFAHHPGLTLPQGHDWNHPDNVPDATYEMLVEIHSEHGCSECYDPTAEGCDFGQSRERPHFPPGTIQSALTLGHRLGFVGGTDSHDSRPGSLADGGGPIDLLVDLDGGPPLIHPYQGAITGVMTVPGADRSALFDALTERATLVSSGPIIPVQAVLIEEDGGVLLPGSDATAGTVRVRVNVPYTEGILLDQIELIRPDNSLIDGSTTDSLDTTFLAMAGDIFYLRIRLITDTREERIWLSPWFID